ncbi:unnamed protein product [Effrenium voratum]|nr:unnamed protein product [Effrenium voratum]
MGQDKDGPVHQLSLSGAPGGSTRRTRPNEPDSLVIVGETSMGSLQTCSGSFSRWACPLPATATW